MIDVSGSEVNFKIQLDLQVVLHIYHIFKSKILKFPQLILSLFVIVIFQYAFCLILPIFSGFSSPK